MNSFELEIEGISMQTTTKVIGDIKQGKQMEDVIVIVMHRSQFLDISHDFQSKGSLQSKDLF